MLQDRLHLLSGELGEKCMVFDLLDSSTIDNLSAAFVDYVRDSRFGFSPASLVVAVSQLDLCAHRPAELTNDR